MFTGIITAIGEITQITPKGDGLHLTVTTPANYLDDVVIGDSIAMNGACMTVTAMKAIAFEVDVSKESISKTTGLNQPGSVNLEKALRFNDRLGGHLVSGHVDGIGTVQSFAPVQDDAYGSWKLIIDAPQSLAPYLAYKGSIVVNGVSLTVNKAGSKESSQCPIEINIIPHTLENTTLGKLKAGDPVNLEVDLIARYVARMLGKDSTDSGSDR
jgi:riboflavin synthase